MFKSVYMIFVVVVLVNSHSVCHPQCKKIMSTRFTISLARSGGNPYMNNEMNIYMKWKNPKLNILISNLN